MKLLDKILFIGKSNRVNNEIYRELSSFFDVHFCAISVSAIEESLDQVLPRLIVFSMAGAIDDCVSTLKYLLKEWSYIPVLGVCDENQQYLEAKCLNVQQCRIILRPESNAELVSVCTSMIQESEFDGKLKNQNSNARKIIDEALRVQPHILVVDDNAMVLRTTKLMLKDRYSVSIAASGAQALVSINKKTPDIILLDYKMPVLDGETTMKILKGNKKNIPVIFFTSADDPDTVKRLISLKPAGYILKPPDKQKLIDLIEKTLEDSLFGFI